MKPAWSFLRLLFLAGAPGAGSETRPASTPGEYRLRSGDVVLFPLSAVLSIFGVGR